MAALPDELIEEILLRFPPHNPSRLVSAALVCKPWCRLLSSPRFRRRFREFHRTPPMLGFLCNRTNDNDGEVVCQLLPNTASSYMPQIHHRRRSWHALDARHGRILLSKEHRCGTHITLVVWDPVTDTYHDLPDLKQQPWRWNAAVLCANAAGTGTTCDHLDCRRGPFVVVVLAIDENGMFTCVYSSDTGAWSEPISSLITLSLLHSMPAALAGNALYFMFLLTNSAVKYDLALHEPSVIQLPREQQCFRVFTTTEDGGLETAAIENSKLYMWSMMKTGDGLDAGRRWIQSRVIELDALLHIDATLSYDNLVGFVDGVRVIFFKADRVSYRIDVNTCQVTKLCDARGVYNVVPYMSFYTPVLGAACIGEGQRGVQVGEGPRTGAVVPRSSA